MPNPCAQKESEFFPTKGKKRVGAMAFASTFGTNLFIQFCTVLQGIMIARMLGPVGRGEYAAVILWPTVFGSFGVAGVYIAIGRIAAQVDDYGSLMRSGIVFALLTSAVSGTACYLSLSRLLPQSESHLISLSKLFILSIPMVRLILNLNAIDQGRGDFRRFNAVRSLINPIYVLMLAALWIMNIRQVRGCVIALLAGYGVAGIVWLVSAAPKYAFIGPLYSLKDILRQSIPFSLAGIFQEIYLHVDKAILLWLLGTMDLGLYTVALSASAAAGSITVSSGMVSFTMAAQAKQGEGFEKLTRVFRVSVLLWVFLGSLLAAGMPLLLPLVYSHDFAKAVYPAQLLIIGSALAGLANMLEQAVRGQGKAYIGLEGRLGGLIVLFVLSVFLTRSFGIDGFCWAFISGQFVCLLVILLRTNNHYGTTSIAAYIPTFEDIVFSVSVCKNILWRRGK